MKISKLFHWLYAAIMFLPLLVAPIFAIYSHRHTIDSYEVTREKYQVLDFNQIVPYGKFNNNDINYWEVGYGSISISNESLVLSPEESWSYVRAKSDYPISFNNNDKLYLSFYARSSINMSDTYFEYTLQNNNYIYRDYVQLTTSWQRINPSNYGVTTNDSDGYFFFYNRDTNIPYIYITQLEVINLTQMFGEGNEPTIAEFNQMYTNDYYDYTLSKKVLIQNGTETLNNTDIGSQFVYAIYNPLNDYFNFNKFLGIGNLYNWMQLNLFKGTAPLGFFIFWELLMYWLLISLIWLIFDVAMYVPKLAHRWLDKASLE